MLIEFEEIKLRSKPLVRRAAVMAANLGLAAMVLAGQPTEANGQKSTDAMSTPTSKPTPELTVTPTPTAGDRVGACVFAVKGTPVKSYCNAASSTPAGQWHPIAGSPRPIIQIETATPVKKPLPRSENITPCDNLPGWFFWARTCFVDNNGVSMILGATLGPSIAPNRNIAGSLTTLDYVNRNTGRLEGETQPNLALRSGDTASADFYATNVNTGLDQWIGIGLTNTQVYLNPGGHIFNVFAESGSLSAALANPVDHLNDLATHFDWSAGLVPHGVYGSNLGLDQDPQVILNEKSDQSGDYFEAWFTHPVNPLEAGPYRRLERADAGSWNLAAGSRLIITAHGLYWDSRNASQTYLQEIYQNNQSILNLPDNPTSFQFPSSLNGLLIARAGWLGQSGQLEVSPLVGVIPTESGSHASDFAMTLNQDRTASLSWVGASSQELLTLTSADGLKVIPLSGSTNPDYAVDLKAGINCFAVADLGPDNQVLGMTDALCALQDSASSNAGTASFR